MGGGTYSGTDSGLRQLSPGWLGQFNHQRQCAKTTPEGTRFQGFNNFETVAFFVFLWYTQKTMPFAVIKTGGKQYTVEPGKKLKVAKLEGDAGAAVVFDQVLLVSDGEKTTVGLPIVAGAKVEASVLRQARTKKIIVFNYRPKARHRKKQGHRQHFTEVEITKISA